MKNSFFILCVLILLSNCDKKDIGDTTSPFLDNNSTGTISSVKTLGGSGNDVTLSVDATSDNGYVIAGYTQSNDGDIPQKPNNSSDFWIVKFDQNHNIQWSKTYGGSGDDRARKVIQTSDNGFVIIGYSDSSDLDVSVNNGFRDFWIIKLDPNGQLLWEKSYGFSGNDEGFNIKENTDGTLIAVGFLDVSAAGNQGNFGKNQINHAGGDYWVLKLSSTGNLIWSRFFGGSFTDTAFDVSVNSENDITVIGSSDSTDSDITANNGTYDFWVVKMDASGNLLWERSFGGSQIDEGRAIVKTINGYLLVGDTRSTDNNVVNNNGGADIWTATIDEDGNILSSNNYGGSNFDVPRNAFSTIDNGFIISGSSRSSDIDLTENKGQSDVWVFKTDVMGNLIWETSVGGSNIDFSHQAVQLNNGTIIVVGESSSNDGDILENKGFTDALIIQIN